MLLNPYTSLGVVSIALCTPYTALGVMSIMSEIKLSSCMNKKINAIVTTFHTMSYQQLRMLINYIYSN